MATILNKTGGGLIPFLLSLIMTFLLAPPHALSQTTSFSYDFYGQQPNNLIYERDAHFPTDTTYLRLTRTNASGYPLGYTAGRVLFPRPIQFWAPTGAEVDFETTVKFFIKTVDNNPADGLAFFIVPAGYEFPDRTGGSFGIFTGGRNPSIFAVEFDTFVNAADPPYRHVGIDIEYLTSVNTTRVDNAILNQEVTALIEYKKATKLIRVSVTANSRTYEVSYAYDLSSVLTQQVQVGLSASSGGQVAVHDIISWYFTATLVHTRSGKEEDIKIQQYV